MISKRQIRRTARADLAGTLAAVEPVHIACHRLDDNTGNLLRVLSNAARTEARSL